MFKLKLKSYKSLAVLFSVVITITACFAVVSAWKDPTAAPGNSFYNLEEIYCKLTNCTAATYGIDSPGAPAVTMHTIEQVYTATPDFRTQGGTAIAADIFSGKTGYRDSSTLLTGTLDLACNDPTFNGTSNLVPTTYDGGGDGTNRWMMTDSGTAVANDIVCTKKAWVNGEEVVGNNITNCATGDAGCRYCNNGSCSYYADDTQHNCDSNYICRSGTVGVCTLNYYVFWNNRTGSNCNTLCGTTGGGRTCRDVGLNLGVGTDNYYANAIVLSCSYTNTATCNTVMSVTGSSGCARDGISGWPRTQCRCSYTE